MKQNTITIVAINVTTILKMDSQGYFVDYPEQDKKYYISQNIAKELLMRVKRIKE
jgi:hypothetical protein